MAYDFPNSPTVGQVYQGYTWDGAKWIAGPGAGIDFGAVRFDSVQSLTVAQQRQARQNIATDNGLVIVDRNNVNQTGLTANALNKIQFTNKIKDANGWFDAVTNFRYTPLIAGSYFVILSINAPTATSNGQTPQAAIMKNGSVVYSGFYMGATSMAGSSLICNLQAAIPMNGTTDYLEAALYTAPGTTTLSGNPQNTFMNIFRVGD